MTKPKRIFVVGHMGAGKAVFADALAKKLGWRLVDVNPSLERYIGRPLNEILGKQGEASFHECEAEVISHYLGQDNIVVLLEEAVVTTEKNRKLLSPEFVIYLKVTTPVQMERMADSGRDPALPIADLKAFLDKLHHERDSLFEEVATLSMDSVSVGGDVDKVLKSFLGP